MSGFDVLQLEVFHPRQAVFQFGQQLTPLPDPFPLLRFPFLLLRLQDQLRGISGARAVGFQALLVGGHGGVEGFVGVVEGELGLSEVVVAFHVVAVELDAAEAVIDAGFPRLEFDAGHGAVGEESWVAGVLLDAGPWIRLSMARGW